MSLASVANTLLILQLKFASQLPLEELCSKDQRLQKSDEKIGGEIDLALQGHPLHHYYYNLSHALYKPSSRPTKSLLSETLPPSPF